MKLNFDLSELNNIDFNDVARWPMPLKVVAIILLCAMVLGAGIWFDTRNQLDMLDKASRKKGIRK